MCVRSGCGKTTLLNILANYKPVTSGAITVNGGPIPKQYKRLSGCESVSARARALLRVRALLN